MRSRYGDRHSKRKQNIVLNSLIGIVLAVILVLVANIVFTGDDSQQTASEEQQTAQTNSDEKSNSTSDDAVTSDEADSKDSDADSESDSATDKDSTKEESTDEEKDQKKEDQEKEDQEKEKADQEPGEPNLEGPWEPVGTTQSGPHTSSYDLGSTDWNEKVKAVESVMGLSADEMTIWKIGGNGGPQQSYARVSKAGSGNQVYYIELEWIDGEGWKPVSVRTE
ncbi:DUF1510 family protein [Guptibacillus hwajinpoensis]|uniref:DUF1510 family protein n=1 Tax=Guptibacillus hwajinpoensis TaxID=208199 RepID=UPI001CFE6D44|nr:DUF1510 family protein [Pseudalkalibacillus hwajinpoensis]